MNEEIKKALYRLGLRLQRELDILTFPYTASGKLHRELQNPSNIRIIEVGGIPEIDLKVPKQLEILDFGRKPGRWAPLSPLQKWVGLKIRPTESKLKSITFLVNRKIFREGIPPKMGAGLITATAKKNAFNIEKNNIRAAAATDAYKKAVAEIKKALIDAKLTQ